MFSFQGTFRRNQIHNLRFETFNFKTRLWLCFSSQIKTRFAGLLICLVTWAFKRLNETSSFNEASVNLFMVESTGIEPVTSCLQGRRSPSWANPPCKRSFEVVGQNGLEPSTSRLSVVCSSQLSYWPISASLLFKVHYSLYPLNWITQIQSEHYPLYWP